MDPISLLMAAQATVAAIRKGCELLSEGKQEISKLKAQVTQGVEDAKAIYNEVSGIWSWITSLFGSTKPNTAVVTNKEVKESPKVQAAVKEATRPKKASQLSYEEYKAQAVHDIFEQLKVFFAIKKQLQEHCRELEETSQTTDDIAGAALDRIEIQWQLAEMNKQISQAMIYQTPSDLGLGSLYKDFLRTYGDIEEEQEFTRQLKKKLELDEKWQQEEIRHLKVDLLVAATITTIVSYVIWSILWSLSTRPRLF
jgi:myosin heavy subunit